VFIEAKDDESGGENWTYWSYVVQSSNQIITNKQTNIQFFTGRMPFLSSNQQCRCTEGKISHSMDLLTPSSPGVF